MITATGGWDWPPGCESSLCYDRVALQYLLYTLYVLCLKMHNLFCIDIKAGSSYLLRLTLFMLLYWELLGKGFAEFIVCDAYGRRQGYTTDERSGCHGGYGMSTVVEWMRSINQSQSKRTKRGKWSELRVLPNRM